MWLLLKNVVFTFVVPGTTTVYLPYIIVSRNANWFPSSLGVTQVTGALLILLGSVIYVRCVWDFAHRGRATPAPIDPPRVLVVDGLYQYVRNPMYLGTLCVIVGEVLFSVSGALALYAVAWFITVHFFTVFYEEPTLRRTFTGSYETYLRSVRRWRPGRPYRPTA